MCKHNLDLNNLLRYELKHIKSKKCEQSKGKQIELLFAIERNR